MALSDDCRSREDKNTWHFWVGENEDGFGDYIEVKRYVSPQFQEHRYAVLTHYGNQRGFLGNNYTLEEVEAYISILTGGRND
jgi:hypothetical protein